MGVNDSKQERSVDSRGWLWLLILIHMPLAILFKTNRQLATVHALAVLLIGLSILVLDRNPLRAQRYIFLVATYGIGAEVLWRMTQAGVFYEYGKYLTIALLGGALLRRPRPLRLHPLPILFFVALLPSSALWLGEDMGALRDQVSFNLSGPLCLAVAALFFYGFPLDRADRRQMFMVLIAPIVAIASVALYSTLTATEIAWTTESNFTTSGGFGPNQVSSLLGLGVVCSWYLIATQKRWTLPGILQLTILLWFVGQSLLTFSRTGIYSAVATIVATLPFLLTGSRDSARHLTRILLLLVVVITMLFLLVIPQLDLFTDGFLTRRFTETNTSGRSQLNQIQWDLWMANPISGVGPGKTKEAAETIFGYEVTSHSEITRLLAEHGIFGLSALLIIVSAGLWRLSRAPSGEERALVVILLAWAATYMIANAMRTAAPSFIYGLAWATLLPSAGAQPATKR